MTGDAVSSVDQELLERLSELETIRGQARALVSGLSEGQFGWRAAPGQWSIAECLVHLNLVGGLYVVRIDRAIERGRAQGKLASGSHRHPLLGRLFVWSMEPPVRMRFKAPGAFAPTSPARPDEALGEFLSLQERLEQKMRQADGLDLGGIRVSSPVSRHVKMSLGQSFALVLAHERRHLWQARQIRSHTTFPEL